MYFRKLRKSWKFDGSSIITRVAGETLKKTLWIDWKKKKKKVSYYFVTHIHSFWDSKTYCKKSVGFYDIIYGDPGFTLRLGNCQNSHVYIFFILQFSHQVLEWWDSKHDAHLGWYIKCLLVTQTKLIQTTWT